MKLDGKVIQEAIMQLIEDFKFDAEQVIDIVKMGIKSAFKKDYQEFKKDTLLVDIDADGEIKVYKILTVVAEVEEDDHISVADAQKIAEGAAEGEELYVDITPASMEFSRIGIQSAAQTIKQHIKGIEKERFFTRFSEKEGELLKGKVTKVNGTTIVLDIEGVPVVLPPEGQIPRKEYTLGEDIFVYLKEISKGQGGVVLDITQSSGDFVEAVLKKIVPEIDEGTVIIEKIVRFAGKKTKVAVRTADENIDPIGVMVGQGGERVRILLSLLDGEKIDFIPYSDDMEEYIKFSLQPAVIDRVEIKKNTVKAYCAEKQKSLAIGGEGVNIKLAAMLTGYKIEIENKK